MSFLKLLGSLDLDIPDGGLNRAGLHEAATHSVDCCVLLHASVSAQYTCFNSGSREHSLPQPGDCSRRQNERVCRAFESGYLVAEPAEILPDLVPHAARTHHYDAEENTPFWWT